MGASFPVKNWHEACERMDLQMGLSQTWNTLHRLIDTDKSKTLQRRNLGRLVHEHRGPDTEILREIKDRYIGTKPEIQLDVYTGIGNSNVDRPITTFEVRPAIHALRTKAAPGPDGVTNKMIRNLDDVSIEARTKYMNPVERLAAYHDNGKRPE